MHKIAMSMMLTTVYLLTYGADTSVPEGFENYTQEFNLVNKAVLNMPLIKRTPLFFRLLLFEKKSDKSLQGLNVQAYDRCITELMQEFKTVCNIQKVSQKHVELADYFCWPTVRAVLIELAAVSVALHSPPSDIHNEIFKSDVRKRLQEKEKLAKDSYFEMWQAKNGAIEKDICIPHFNGVSCAELFCYAKSKRRLHKFSLGFAEIKLHNQHLNDLNGIGSFPRTHMCQALWLEGNRLQQLIPLPTFARLTTISLSNNQLRAFPHELKDLPALEILILTANNISKIPTVVHGFNKLVGLNLAQNGIKEFPDILEGFPALQEFVLDHNEIAFFKGVPQGMKSMLKLDLSCNPIVDLYGVSVERMGTLEELTLKETLVRWHEMLALQKQVEEARGQGSFRIVYESVPVTQ